MQQRATRHRRGDEDEIEEMPEAQKKDLKDIDALLDEIEEVLETEDQREIERIRFKDKLHSINFWPRGRRREIDPCRETIRLPRGVHPGPGWQIYDGPPCVDC